MHNTVLTEVFKELHAIIKAVILGYLTCVFSGNPA